MKKGKRIKRMWLCIIVLLVGFFFVPSFRSEAVMRPVSFLADRDSVMRKQGFRLVLPDGSATVKKDWTSSMKVFHATAFESAEDPVSATILYNFASFSGGRSRLYDPGSSYEMAYYGAYAVFRDGEDRPFGFEADGTINQEELAMIPLYDLEYLVLRGLGCPGELARSRIVRLEIKELEDKHSLAGWICVDTEIDTRSVVHEKDGWNQNDLQYGPPPKTVEESFPPLRLKGRVYAKAFPEWESTIYLYVFAKDQALIEETDEVFLQNVRISARESWVP